MLAYSQNGIQYGNENVWFSAKKNTIYMDKSQINVEKKNQIQLEFKLHKYLFLTNWEILIYLVKVFKTP